MLAVLPPSNYSVDGASMVAMAESMSHGHLTVPCDVGIPGRGGACYSRWYPLLSVLSVPFVLVGQGLGELVSLPSAYIGRLLALAVPALAMAGAAALTTLLGLELGGSRKASVAAGCAFAFCTEAFTFGRTGYAETLGAFVVALAAWGFAGQGRRRWIGIAAVGLAVLVKPQLVVVGVAIGVAFAVTDKSWKPLLEALAATVLGGLAFLGYNWLRFESLWNFGGADRTLEAEGYAPSSFVESVALLIASPGRGLVVFSPVVVLGAWTLWRHRRCGVAAAGLAVTVALLVLYANKPGVVEGWGTRYLVPALPLLCVGIALLGRRHLRVAAVLAGVGLLIHLPTLLAPHERINAERVEQGVLVQEYWKPSKSAALAHWPAALRQVGDARDSDPRQLVNEAGRPTGTDVGDQGLLRVVFMWWWMLPAAGLPRALGLIVALVLLAIGVRLLWRAAAPGQGSPGGAPAVAARLTIPADA